MSTDKMPTVSVIIPIYNGGKYIETAVRSVLAQTFDDFELIIVDDGSTDDGPGIIDRLAAEDDRITAIHQKNAGVSAARNAGLDMAKGSYATFLDGDDWYRPDFLEKMLTAARDCQLVSCAFTTFGTEHPPQVRKLPAQAADNLTAMRFMLGYNSFNGYVWNKLFSMEVIRAQGLRFEPGYPACEDALFVGNFLYHARQVRILDEELYSYRQVNSGANRGRYSGKVTYVPKWMTVFTMCDYFRQLYTDPQVQKACFLHEVREAGIVLRSMEAAGYRGEEYTRLKKLLRGGTLAFIQDENSDKSQKLSVLLTFISPKLELAVWRCRNRR